MAPNKKGKWKNDGADIVRRKSSVVREMEMVEEEIEEDYGSDEYVGGATELRGTSNQNLIAENWIGECDQSRAVVLTAYLIAHK